MEIGYRQDLITTISPLDTMCETGREEDYFKIGRGALDKCKKILEGAEPVRIVDFPSGYGRVLRWFKYEWPTAELIAVETDASALNFVSQTFGAVSVQSHPRLEMTIPSHVDLIFSGSLLTHFDGWQWDRFLKMNVDALRPGGILIFTIHGRVNALLLKENPLVYGELIDGRALYAKYIESGFAFQAYDANYPEFGVSLSSPEWTFRILQKLPLAKVVAFEEQGWGQDIVAIQKNGWSMI